MFLGHGVEQVVQIGVSNLWKLQGVRHARIGRRKNYDVIVVAIIPRVGFTRVAEEVEVDGERLAQIAAGLQPKVDVGIKDHLGQRFVISIHQRGVVGAVTFPYFMQLCFFIKVLQQSAKSHDGHGIWR